ncbi:uncharacterized protein [Coffea arabica]|uniref:Reverse transcriptase zinc-binding domain-containing protein n=1 Tax=Coffea arabica TaxID=13443 RepID=A0ABM4X8L6_COFAR
MGARQLVEQGTRRKIGNGMNTNVWEDSWIPDTLHGGVTTKRAMDNGIQNADLPKNMEQEPGYKTQALNNDTKQKANKMEGSTSWENQTQKPWKDLWRLKVKHKQKIFLWKFLNNALPVRDAIYGRIKVGDPICNRYGEERETIEHTLLNCSKAKQTWKLAPIQWEGMMEQHGCFRRWWISVLEAKHRPEGWQHISLFVHILWQIWKDRNEMEFNGKKNQPWRTIQKAHQEWLELGDIDTKETRMNTDETEALRHHSQQLGSEYGTLKLRIGFTTDLTKLCLGIGISLTEGDQGLKIGWALRARSLGSNLVDEEAVALKMAMCKAVTMQYREVQFQVQNQQLLNHIRTQKVSDIRLVTVVDDIVQLRVLFYMCSFCLVKHDKNQLSSKLSMYALGMTLEEEHWFP